MLGPAVRRWVALVGGVLCPLAAAGEACLAGRLVDFTHNSGKDRRIWSSSLGLRRDLYVYLPPGYDPHHAYPLLLWLHGFGGDEEQFTAQVVYALDQAIVRGELPPVVAAAPDGSLPTSIVKPWHTGSWFLNSRKGNWEDYVLSDMLGFLETHFSLRQDRSARVIAGWSMGGFAAYNLGLKHPEKFRHLVGVYPNLDLRYADCHGNHQADFDPSCTGKLCDLRWHWHLGVHPKYKLPVKMGMVYFPVFGRRQTAVARMAEESPVELIDRLGIAPDQFQMFVAYGGKDDYNIDAQVDSYLHHVGQRGFAVWVRRHPDGRHVTEWVNECLPEVFRALGPHLPGPVPLQNFRD